MLISQINIQQNVNKVPNLSFQAKFAKGPSKSSLRLNAYIQKNNHDLAKTKFWDTFNKYFKNNIPEALSDKIDIFKYSTTNEFNARSNFLDFVRNNDLLYKNKGILNDLCSVLYYRIKSEKDVEEITPFINLVTSSEPLRKDEELINNLLTLVGGSKKEDIEAYSKLINFYLNNDLCEKFGLDDSLLYILTDVNRDNIDVKIKVLDEILSNKKFENAMCNFEYLISNINSKESADSKLYILDKILNDNLEQDASIILDVVALTDKNNVNNILYNIETLNSLSSNYSDKFKKSVSTTSTLTNKKIDKNIISNLETPETAKLVEHIHNMISKKHENFLEINTEDREEIDREVEQLFEKMYIPFCLMSKLFDKQTINTILSHEGAEVVGILSSLVKLTNKDFEFLSESLKNNFSDTSPSRKLNFFKEFSYKKEIGIDMTNSDEDNPINYTIKTLKYLKVPDETIDELFDEELEARSRVSKYFPTLNNSAFDFSEIFAIDTLEQTIDYIVNLSPNNYRFNEMEFWKRDINIKNWLFLPLITKPKDILLKSNGRERLQLIASKLEEDIANLRKTPAGRYFDKIYHNDMHKKFVIPKEVKKEKISLLKYVKNMISSLDKIWNRARINAKSDDEKILQKARQTLTILDHLNEYKDILENYTDFDDKDRQMNLSIKVWDRLPYKDVFQGNFSTCCIGLGKCNDIAMIRYLLSSSYNMLEFVDKDNNETIGNALIYFVEEKDGKPALMIDNIEINNNYAFAKEQSKLLLDSIKKYAKYLIQNSLFENKYFPEDINIYLGSRYNDINVSDLETTSTELRPIAIDNSNEQYIDAFGGWRRQNSFFEKIDVYKLT